MTKNEITAWNPETDPAGCSICTENAVTTDIPRPSGNGYQVRCAHGHVTNGMPSREWFVKNFPQGMARKV